MNGYQSGTASVMYQLPLDPKSPVDGFIAALVPGSNERAYVMALSDRLKDILTTCFGATVFETGSLLSKISIPGERVELTQILPRKQCENWCTSVVKTICEQLTPDDDLGTGMELNSVHFCPKSNVVSICTESITFKLSPNNTSTFFIASIAEELNARIGNSNLLKRSLLLIKSWCVHESSVYTPEGISRIFTHDAMTVMTLWIFHWSTEILKSPLHVLVAFLKFYSTFDWSTQGIGVFGPYGRTDALFQNRQSADGRAAAARRRSTSGSGTGAADDASVLSSPSSTSSATPSLTKASSISISSAVNAGIGYELERIVSKYAAMHSKFETPANTAAGSPALSSQDLAARQLQKGHAGTCFGSGAAAAAANIGDAISSGIRSNKRGGLTNALCEFQVLDPVGPYNNLCEPTTDRKTAITSQELQSAFSRGAAIFEKLLSANSDEKSISGSGSESVKEGVSNSPAAAENPANKSNSAAAAAATTTTTRGLSTMTANDFIAEYFPVSGEIILSRMVRFCSTSSASVYDSMFTSAKIQQLRHAKFDAVNANLYARANDYLNTCWPDDMSNLREMMFCITRAQVILAKASPEMIVYLIFQILQKHGCLAVGEVGKHIQDIVGEKDVLKMIKSPHRGLKTFIAQYSAYFTLTNEHPFNPRVFIATSCPLQGTSQPPSNMNSANSTPTASMRNMNLTTNSGRSDSYDSLGGSSHNNSSAGHGQQQLSNHSTPQFVARTPPASYHPMSSPSLGYSNINMQPIQQAHQVYQQVGNGGGGGGGGVHFMHKVQAQGPIQQQQQQQQSQPQQSRGGTPASAAGASLAKLALNTAKMLNPGGSSGFNVKTSNSNSNNSSTTSSRSNNININNSNRNTGFGHGHELPSDRSSNIGPSSPSSSVSSLTQQQSVALAQQQQQPLPMAQQHFYPQQTQNQSQPQQARSHVYMSEQERQQYIQNQTQQQEQLQSVHMAATTRHYDYNGGGAGGGGGGGGHRGGYASAKQINVQLGVGPQMSQMQQQQQQHSSTNNNNNNNYMNSSNVGSIGGNNPDGGGISPSGQYRELFHAQTSVIPPRGQPRVSPPTQYRDLSAQQQQQARISPSVGYRDLVQHQQQQQQQQMQQHQQPLVVSPSSQYRDLTLQSRVSPSMQYREMSNSQIHASPPMQFRELSISNGTSGSSSSNQLYQPTHHQPQHGQGGGTYSRQLQQHQHQYQQQQYSDVDDGFLQPQQRSSMVGGAAAAAAANGVTPQGSHSQSSSSQFSSFPSQSFDSIGGGGGNNNKPTNVNNNNNNYRNGDGNAPEPPWVPYSNAPQQNNQDWRRNG